MAYEGIEVVGRSVEAVLAGFGRYRELASQLLLKAGIGSPDKNGECMLGPGSWYPLEKLLEVMETIQKQSGREVLYEVGRSILPVARIPEFGNDLVDVLRKVDVAYHMNHRRDGEVMFDPRTGRIHEGIGHYGFEKVQGQHRVVSVCDTPYPCDMDRGVLTAFAHTIDPSAVVTHQPGACRQSGARSCTYHVTWH